MLVPRLYILCFNNDSPTLNNAVFIEKTIEDAGSNAKIFDITDSPFLLFDTLSVNYALNKAGITDNLCAKDISEIAHLAGLSDKVCLVRRAYLSILKLSVLYYFRTYKNKNSQHLSFNPNRRYFFMFNDKLSDTAFEALSKYNIEVSEISRFPSIPVFPDTISSFLLNTACADDLSPLELMELAKIAGQDKAVEDMRLLYFRITQDACVKAWESLREKKLQSII